MAERPATDPDHARHDPLRVAEAADRGATLPPDLAACPDCRALHADLVAIAAALPGAALPVRPRDYRLTPDDAARLRRTGWRRWFATIGSPRDTITRPLAVGLTTLGLAGLLVAGIPSLAPSSSSGSAPAAAGGSAVTADQGAPAAEAQDESAIGKEAPPSAAAPSGAALLPLAGAGAQADGPSGGRDTVAGATVAPEERSTTPTQPASSAGTAAGDLPSVDAVVIATPVPAPPSGPLVVALTLLIAGLALFVLRGLARHSARS